MQQILGEQRTERLDRSAQAFIAARPAQEPILRAFQQIFRQRLDLAARILASDFERPAFDPEAVEGGQAWLTRADLGPMRGVLVESARETLPAMAAAFPQGEALRGIETLFLSPSFDLPGACRGLLDRDHSALDRAAEAAGLAPAMTRFALEAVMAAPAMALAAGVEVRLREISWLQGSCPACGRLPSIAFLARAEQTGLEALVGGGGQKHLHCSLCGHLWRFRRDACPNCAAAEPGTREILHAVGAREERIELCHACRTYHLSIDLREYQETPELLIVPVALMHLDLIARERGAAPLYAAPWNAGA